MHGDASRFELGSALDLVIRQLLSLSCLCLQLICKGCHVSDYLFPLLEVPTIPAIQPLPLIRFFAEIWLSLAWNAHSLFIFYRFHSPRCTWRCSISPCFIHLLLGLLFALLLSSFKCLLLALIALWLDYDAAQIIANGGVEFQLQSLLPFLHDFLLLWNLQSVSA